MPTTTAEHNRSLVTPGIYSLLPIRDFLPGALTAADGVMVRTDGCYVAGFHLGGSLTYFGDDAAMNEMKARVEALLRTVPEESMRVQFRYEVVENANGLIDRYEALQRTESDVARRMDAIRIEGWRKEEEHSEFLTRLAAVYFIWDPALHERLNRTTTSVLAGHKDELKSTGGSRRRLSRAAAFLVLSNASSRKLRRRCRPSHKPRSARKNTSPLSLSLRASSAALSRP